MTATLQEARRRGVRQPRVRLDPPGRRVLLGASLLATVASFLPWVDTSFGTFWGLDGPGRWTLYAAMFGLAGALLRRPRLVVLHGTVLGIVALWLPAWQLLRLATTCPPGGCLPSTGLLLTMLAGVAALRAAWLGWRGSASRSHPAA